ncbi:MAG: DUF1049 domain-containing protein [Leptolyngbyaceae cyanobacterium]
MKSLVNLLTSIIIAAWISGISILAIQNFSPVSLKFLMFQSFDIPVGLVLAFSVSVGMVSAAILPPLLLGGGSGNSDPE